MEISVFVMICILVCIGSYSLNAMGRYIPKRKRYSYLYYDEREYGLPMMAWVHFWVVLGSYALAVWLIVAQ